MTDILMNALEHSWGTSPEQKKREKEYNAEYYRKHKEKWKDNSSKVYNPPMPGFDAFGNSLSTSSAWYGPHTTDSAKKQYWKKNYSQMEEFDAFGNPKKKDSKDSWYDPHTTDAALRKRRNKMISDAAAENERARLAEAERKSQLAAKKAYYLSEIEKEQAKQNKSTGKKIREFIDGTVEIAIDKAAKNISEGINFLSDFFGISSSSSESRSSKTTASTSRPRSRQKNVTQNGTGVNRRGDGLGIGPTGKWR